jgi:hypothetical protein
VATSAHPPACTAAHPPPLPRHCLQLNAAYSAHEIVGDYTTAVLKWFESGGAGNLTQLAEVCVWPATAAEGKQAVSGIGGPGCSRLGQAAAGQGGKPTAGCRSLICPAPSPARPTPQEYIIRRPALLTGDRLQPGQKPASAGDGPVPPGLALPPPAPALQAPAPGPAPADTLLLEVR